MINDEAPSFASEAYDILRPIVSAVTVHTYMEVMDALPDDIKQKSLRGRLIQRVMITKGIRLHHTLYTDGY